MKWEYKIVRDNEGGSGPIQEWQLNDLGAWGWELVAVSHSSTGDRSFIFKRALK